MILTSHAIVGAAIASAIPSHPISAFILAVLSHLLLDAVPHWQYPLNSIKRSDASNPDEKKIERGPGFKKDVLRVGTDALLGIILGCLLFWPSNNIGLLTMALAIFGSLMPDGLTFLYAWGWRFSPLAEFRRFHRSFHAKDRSLEEKPLLGIPLQILIVTMIAIILTSVRS